MGDHLKDELQIAQRRWIQRVLGIDVAQEEVEGIGIGSSEAELETARRRGVRAELAARVRAVTGVTAERLRALTPGTHGATQLISQVKALKGTMDGAMTNPYLVSDEVDRGKFESAAQRARDAIEALQVPWQEMQTTGTAQGIETQQRTEEHQKVRANDERNRDLLKQQAATVLQTATEGVSAILKVLPPGAIDLEIRNASAKLWQAQQRSEFTDPDDHDGFVRAGKAVHDAIEEFEALVQGELATGVLRAAAIGKAWLALDSADQAAAEASQARLLFGEVTDALVEGLVKARREATAPTAAKAKEIEDFAKDEAARARLITAAEATGVILGEQVKTAAEAADETPGKTLRDAWDSAVAMASNLLLAGSAAVETLEGVGPTLEATGELTAAAARLRERIEAWKKAHGELPLPPSTAESKTLEPAKALFTTIEADLPEIGTLDIQLGAMELALGTIAAAMKLFKDRADLADAGAQKLPTMKGWKSQPGPTLQGLVKNAIEQRKRDATAAGESLRKVETLLSGYVTFCAGMTKAAELVELVGQLYSDNLQSIASAANNRFVKLEPVGEVQQRLDTELKILGALDAYRQQLAPMGGRIEALKRSKTNAIASYTRKRTEGALEFAKKGDAVKSADALGEVIGRVPAMEEYAKDADVTIEAIRKLLGSLPDPLKLVVNKLLSDIGKATSKEDYTAAMPWVQALAALLPGAPAYRTAHGNAAKALPPVLALKPAGTRTADAEANKAFAARLDVAVDTTAIRLKAVTDDLVSLLDELKLAKETREKAISGALGGKSNDPRLARLFSDPEALDAAMALSEAVGDADLKTLIAAIGQDDNPSLGQAINQALKDLATGLPDGKLKELSDAVGGIEKLAGFIEDTGHAGLAVNLHKEFEADLPKLTSLLEDGFGDDPKRALRIVEGGAAGARRAKQLSDSFVDRTELADLIDKVGQERDVNLPPRTDSAIGDRQAGRILRSIVAYNFVPTEEPKTPDWGKLKDPFYDKLAQDPDGIRLMQKAANFKSEAPGTPPSPTLHGFSSVDMVHTMTRHRPESFDLRDVDNIKPSNTQFAANTAQETIASIIGKALGLLKGVLDGTPNAAVAHFQTNGNYIKYQIDVADPGVQIQVGYYTNTMAVTQAFPVKVLNPTTITLDEFDNVQMNTLKGALGK